MASRPVRIGALLAVVALLGCKASAEPPIRSHLALFRVDASALQARDASKDDAVTKAVLGECADGRLSSRLCAAVDEQCGAGATTLLPRAFAKNLDYAWDQDPAPDLAIVARVKPHVAPHEDEVGGAIIGTCGWLLIGIPGYFVDDYSEHAPFELEIALYEGVERSDRDLGHFTVGADSVSTNFIDRNGATVLPYVMTIIIPPHLVSRWDQDDPDTVAELLLESIARTAALGISARIRQWELAPATERQ